MIITLISVGMLILGIILWVVGVHIYSDGMEIMGGFLTIISIITVSVVLFVIIVAHTHVNLNIERNQITYNSLCERLEIIDSEYEDVSKSDIISDIATRNRSVIQEKYFTENPWTSWFHSVELTESLKTIDY